MNHPSDPAIIRVLMIEDSAFDAVLIEETLEAADAARFDLQHVESMAEAEVLAAGNPAFDLVLLDLTLPDSQGVETVDRVRELLPGLPIVVMTGYDCERVALQAVQAGAQDFLVKDQLGSRLLVRTIRHAMERHRMLIDLARSRDEVQHLATHDPLTHLPNRLLFYDLLSQAISSADRRRRSLAVLFLDLDGFKGVNDTYGHEAGDEVLCLAARRLSLAVRDSDVVARLGGDEFTILVEGLSYDLDAARVAQQLQEALEEPFRVQGNPVRIGGSVGIATYPGDGTDAATLVRNADRAMYSVKKRADRKHLFFSREMNARADRQNRSERAWIRSLDSDDRVVRYQPVLDTVAGKTLSMEALPECAVAGEMLSPVDAAASGDRGWSRALGERVLDHALRDLFAWREAGHEELSVTVPLSGRVLRDREFVDRLSRMLEQRQVDPRLLALTFPESALLGDCRPTDDLLQSLGLLGVSLIVDGFGSGQSQLGRLCRIPATAIRFGPELAGGSEREDLTGAVVALGRSLGLEPMARGIDDAALADHVASHGCRRMQGDWFAPAMSCVDADRWLAGGLAAELRRRLRRSAAPPRRRGDEYASGLKTQDS
ncbi:hypothetical protein ABI59_06270 [Acidobacteria bacterium Mor1]|nr:hypothetical protein ABI59_06270 [Acidobacteria bacterium Mor1]